MFIETATAELYIFRSYGARISLAGTMNIASLRDVFDLTSRISDE